MTFLQLEILQTAVVNQRALCLRPEAVAAQAHAQSRTHQRNRAADIDEQLPTVQQIDFVMRKLRIREHAVDEHKIRTREKPVNAASSTMGEPCAGERMR